MEPIYSTPARRGDTVSLSSDRALRAVKEMLAINPPQPGPVTTRTWGNYTHYGVGPVTTMQHPPRERKTVRKFSPVVTRKIGEAA